MNLIGRSLRRAVVTAHPDDETLWAGGLLIRYPGDWTVICCSTPQRDPIRAVKFLSACQALGARGTVLRHEENLQMSLAGFDEIDLAPFDLIVTHNAEGEYGHRHHKQVHAHVLKVISDTTRMLTFGYGRKASNDPYLTIELSDHEWERKLAALKCYDHPINWGGYPRPSWDALLTEYGSSGPDCFGFNLKVETFHYC